MTDSEWLKSFKDMWKACRNPSSLAELVASSDIERLIKLAEKPTFNAIAKGCEHANYSIERGQHGENMVYCHDCKEYIEL